MRNGLIGAIANLYAAADDSSKWSASLSSIGRLLHGTSTNLLDHDHRSRGGIRVAIGADPELYRLYSEFGHAIDPWARSIRPGANPPGIIVVGTSAVAHARLRKIQYYAAMGHRYECTRAIIGVLEASPERTAALTVNRGDRGPEFDAHDVRVLENHAG